MAQIEKRPSTSKLDWLINCQNCCTIMYGNNTTITLITALSYAIRATVMLKPALTARMYQNTYSISWWSILLLYICSLSSFGLDLQMEVLLQISNISLNRSPSWLNSLCLKSISLNQYVKCLTHTSVFLLHPSLTFIRSIYDLTLISKVIDNWD